MPIVGIDLGTTNSLVAVMDGKVPIIIPNRNGRRLTPSVVGLDSLGQIHVGDSAKNQLPLAPERTAAEVKRLMGQPELVRLGDRTYRPQELSGFVLKSLKDDAEKHLGTPVREAVVTVPAYFTDAQRQATKDAGELAGLVVERIINEPTAAALAYGIDRLDQEEFLLIYDLGGGTFDVSVLEMFAGVLEVKASAGDTRLGGSDFDRAIVTWLCTRAKEELGLDLSRDAKALARMKAAAEQAKIDLSTARAVPILLPFVGLRGGEPVSLETELTRDTFERLVGDRLRATLAPIRSALKDAALDPAAISDVILVGGSSRIPLVHQLLAEFFGKPARAGVNPDEAVALGAAVQAGLKSGAASASTGIMITDVCPFTLGVETLGQTEHGAYVPGIFSAIIPRNSTIPISRTEVYRTTSDGQQAVDIRVFQGEDRLVRNNVLLDAYTVEGIPPAKAAAEAVAISFSYDLNGILNVKTKIVSTGKEACLDVKYSPRRLAPLERTEARERIEREWKPPVRESDLAAVGRARMAALRDEAQRQALGAALKELEGARSAGDPQAVVGAEEALTELLFELEDR
ncbi:MAG: Hsp70 family protein [Myxococcaceae bacterium]